MKIRLNKSFGEIEIETSDDKDAIAQASFWSELPDVCPLCGANLFLHFRVTKEGNYKYYELHCAGQPRHFTQFGQYVTGGLFYKSNSWAEHTYGVQSERDAEIAKYDDHPSEYLQRIQKGIAAIKALGGRIEPQGRNESDKDYYESLLAQHARLSKQ